MTVWSHFPPQSGHLWWYRAWNGQRRLLTFSEDTRRWYLLDDGHVDDDAHEERGYSYDHLCDFAADDGDKFTPAIVPEVPA